MIKCESLLNTDVPSMFRKFSWLRKEITKRKQEQKREEKKIRLNDKGNGPRGEGRGSGRTLRFYREAPRGAVSVL